MFRLMIVAAAALFAFAGCAPLPPTPEDTQAKKFEPAPPGKAVIYLVRTNPDWGDLTATVFLDDEMMGSTHQGTYFRWEVNPGRHRITGFASDMGAITLDVQAGRTYFVQHSVLGGGRVSTPSSRFWLMPENAGRAAVRDGMLVGRLGAGS